METFFDGYVTAALWSSMDESNESGGYPLDRNYTERDMAPETLEKMKYDCDKFLLWDGDKICRAQEQDSTYTDERAGVDFWLTRNGHGAGFWSWDFGEIGDALAKAAHAFGEYNLYIGDDGKIYGG